MRGQDKERIGQRPRLALDRDLALLHRFEQRALRPWRGPIDLVDEQDVREHGPGHEAKVVTLEQARTQDVAGQQVGRSLDARKAEPQRAAEGARQERLADTWNVLHQRVTVGQQRDREQPQWHIVNDHRATHGLAQVVPESAAIGVMKAVHGASLASVNRTYASRP